MRHSIIVLILFAQFAFAQAEQRANHLSKGVNLSLWFSQRASDKYTTQHLETFTTAEDIALIKRMGFDHVRFPIEPDQLWTWGKAEVLKPDFLAQMDRVVDAALKNALAVVIDIHPSHEFKEKLQTQDQHVEEFRDFWRSLAKHYSTRDPNLVFFETLNESEFKDRFRWMGVQQRLVAAIRQGAPQHTIIVSGANWSAPDELLSLEPLGDRNIVYNFHFYEPHIFTHQGASWAGHLPHYLSKIPYPSSPEAVAKVADQVPSQPEQQELVRYGLNHWNAARIESEFHAIAQWAKQNGVRVPVNEFGVFRDYADAADRARWIRDVRTTAEKYGFGWTIWDYQTNFGVVQKQNGKTVVDPITAEALGVKIQ
jgi:endoglucanase